MDVLRQSPQPTIQCYHSVSNGAAVEDDLYYEFTPASSYISGKNLQSYNFEKSIDNFGGSFSFTVKESIASSMLFMNEVKPLDIIVISESGTGKVDFIGVVTKFSIGGTASNMNKIITVSGKSIEWLFVYYNLNTDIKCLIFNNSYANKIFKTDLANNDGKEGMSIKDIVLASYKAFNAQINPDEKSGGSSAKDISNFIIGEIINLWYGSDFADASTEKFLYPISSNLFSDGKINVIDYIKKLLPPPIYEIFGYIDSYGHPKIKVREAPFDKPVVINKINPVLLTDFTLTKTCEEVYTAFMPYIEGSPQSPDFYMNLQAAEGDKEKGYNSVLKDEDKAKVYGYQLLTCSFVGYNSVNVKDSGSDDGNSNSDSGSGEEALNNDGLKDLAEKLKRWFGNLDEMYSGDLTVVNMTSERKAGIGEWIGFAGGAFYVTSETHSWNFGDNPMINYQVIRGGEYINGNFKPLQNISAAYKELE